MDAREEPAGCLRFALLCCAVAGWLFYHQVYGTGTTGQIPALRVDFAPALTGALRAEGVPPGADRPQRGVPGRSHRAHERTG